MRETGFRDWLADRGVLLIKLLTSLQDWYQPPPRPLALLDRLLADPDARQYLGVNRYNDILWYDGDGFASLRSWLYWLAAVAPVEAAGAASAADIIAALATADAAAGYQVMTLRDLLAAEEGGMTEEE